MTKKQIEYVLAVARYESFTKAAQALYISQPSLTQQVSALERELGFDLFKRLHNRVTLTDAGNEMIKCFSDFIDSFDTMYAKAAAISKGVSGTISVGILGMMDCTDILNRISEFIMADSSRRQWVYNGHMKEIFEMLISGRLDVAFVFDDLIPDYPQIQYSPLQEVEYVIVYSAEDKDLQKDNVSVRDLSDKPYFQPDEHSASKITLEDHKSIFNSLGIDITGKTVIVPSVATAYDFVISENGFAVCSQLSTILKQSRYRYLDTGISHNLCAVWLGNNLSPIAENLLKTVFHIDPGKASK